MKYLTILLAITASLLLVGPVRADRLTSLDRFELWNNCQPTDLAVELLSQDAIDIGLTDEKITTAIRSRLRAARLYDSSAQSLLYVNVSVVGRAFSVVVVYGKRVFDVASGEAALGRSWYRGSTGTHGGDSGYILSSVSQHMDVFIDEYLRVNEGACTR